MDGLGKKKGKRRKLPKEFLYKTTNMFKWSLWHVEI